VNKFIGETLGQEVEKAAIKLRSDTVWADLGRGAVREMIMAMGFKSVNQFNHFIRTGEMQDLKDGDGAGASSMGNKGSAKKPAPDVTTGNT
ncbi:hypothetical protein, partial [Vibrio cholerae]|uniref:hypothetical protein n=1 Tax=Vibrio cholerae TaxID=666 RepID=UPI001C40AE39